MSYIDKCIDKLNEAGLKYADRSFNDILFLSKWRMSSRDKKEYKEEKKKKKSE